MNNITLTTLASENPFDKMEQTADWLDWECDRVHLQNEAYRRAHGM